jgi:hypothetical protein
MNPDPEVLASGILMDAYICDSWVLNKQFDSDMIDEACSLAFIHYVRYLSVIGDLLMGSGSIWERSWFRIRLSNKSVSTRPWHLVRLFRNLTTKAQDKILDEVIADVKLQTAAARSAIFTPNLFADTSGSLASLENSLGESSRFMMYRNSHGRILLTCVISLKSFSIVQPGTKKAYCLRVLHQMGFQSLWMITRKRMLLTTLDHRRPCAWHLTVGIRTEVSDVQDMEFDRIFVGRATEELMRVILSW